MKHIQFIWKKLLSTINLLIACTKSSTEYKNTFKLRGIYYSQNKQAFLAEIELADKGASLIKPINEIAHDDNFICGFNPIDARTLGYMSCYEQFRKT